MLKFVQLVVRLDGDIELVFVTFGPFSIGLRLDRVPTWVADKLRPQT